MPLNYSGQLTSDRPVTRQGLVLSGSSGAEQKGGPLGSSGEIRAVLWVWQFTCGVG